MIRLVTVIGHGLDLLPHFIEHYQDYVDEIQIVAYKSDLHPNIDLQIYDTIEKYHNVNVVKTVYDRVFDWKRVTDLYNEITNHNPYEWWVVADIDEFHIYPMNIKELTQKCDENGWDLVRGGFVDRIGEGGTFPPITNEPIWETFPLGGFFRFPMSGACPNKIPLKRGYVKLTSGQHYAELDGHTTWRWQGWNHPMIAPYKKYSIQVHHFKWDKTSIERVKQVSDNNQEYSYSDEYRLMYENLQKSNFLIDIYKNDYMIENISDSPYNQWNKLINKIVSL
jgi:hypothetical protein